MVRPIAFAVLVCACVLGSASKIGSAERLTIRVRPEAALEPAYVTVRTTIEANDANRSLEVIIESPDFYRSSWIQLDGVNAPRVSVFEFPSLPNGYYKVRGILGGPTGRRAVALGSLNVVPAFAIVPR